MKAAESILFSGGAPGAEAAFGANAERRGVEEVNFTFDGHRIERHRGVRVLNHEELLGGDVSLEYVARLMHRRYTDSPTIRRVLQTLWYQVNHGQEIYVIGAILDDGTVQGRNGLGRGVREAVQQTALRLRSGQGHVASLERRASGIRSGSTMPRSSRIRTSPAPAHASCATTAGRRSRTSSADPSTETEGLAGGGGTEQTGYAF